MELIDVGDRLVLLADLPLRGQSSRVPLTSKLAAVITVKDGRVIRQQDYYDHGEALEAVGLQE